MSKVFGLFVCFCKSRNQDTCVASVNLGQSLPSDVVVVVVAVVMIIITIIIIIIKHYQIIQSL